MNRKLCTALCSLLLVCVAEHRTCAQATQRNNNPVSAALLDSVKEKVHEGNLNSLDELANTNSNKAISYLVDFIIPQDKADSPIAKAAGAALVKMHAEADLRDKIIEYRKAGRAHDRDRLIAFSALSFMPTKAAVRALASFLDDTTTPEESSVIGDNAGTASFYLARMNIPGAPMDAAKSEFLSVDDVVRWQQWWKSNAGIFAGDGPLHKE